MRRHRLTPRPGWQAKVEAVGFSFHSHQNDAHQTEGGSTGVYWDERAAWEFTADEVDVLEGATNELHRICLEAVEAICGHPQKMAEFAIPEKFWPWIAQSWQRRDPHVYGRFDLAYDPASPVLGQPKMLEYNADTPTTLLESAVVQWYWLQDIHPDADQFNSVHERLIARWKEIGARMAPGSVMHLSSFAEETEEFMTVMYLADTVVQAGIAHQFIAIPDVGWNAGRQAFVDLNERIMSYWFKLYPWEWMLTDAYADHLLLDHVGVIEPPWKMLLSNKAILPILWELFPNHPNLLPAFREPGKLGGDFIAKPILAREGSNIDLRRSGVTVVKTDGTYGDSPLIYQRAVDLPRVDGNTVLIGSWVVADESAGMIVREAEGPIVGGGARVVPHFFR